MDGHNEEKKTLREFLEGYLDANGFSGGYDFQEAYKAAEDAGYEMGEDPSAKFEFYDEDDVCDEAKMEIDDGDYGSAEDICSFLYQNEGFDACYKGRWGDFKAINGLDDAVDLFEDCGSDLEALPATFKYALALVDGNGEKVARIGCLADTWDDAEKNKMLVNDLKEGYAFLIEKIKVEEEEEKAE